MLNIFHNADECPEFLPLNSLVNDKYERVTSKIADGTIDCIIIDPPYTDGTTDALPNHKIQTKIDIDHVIHEAYRMLKPDGFFVFFGQMPTMDEWTIRAKKIFKFRDHITWCKRNITSPYLAIQRSKEDIFIYAKGKPPYYETQEKYEDLKVAGVNLGLYELTSWQAYIKNLQRRVKDNAYNMLYFQGINVDNSPVPAPTNVPNEDDFADDVLEELDKLEKVLTEEEVLKQSANNDAYRGRRLLKAVRSFKDKDFDVMVKNQNENRPLSDRRNDALVHNAFQKTLEKRKHSFEDLDKDQTLEFGTRVTNDEWLGKKLNATDSTRVGYQDPASNDKSWNKGRTVKSAHRYESKHWCNITNTWYFLPEPEDRAAAEICTVWSYLGQNQTTFGANGENWKHPTVKPVKLLKRLIKLLTPEPEKAGYTPVVLDFFLGAGTTSKAAAELGRAFIGVELQPDYFAMCVARTKGALTGEKVLSKDVVTASEKPQTPQQQKLF